MTWESRRKGRLGRAFLPMMLALPVFCFASSWALAGDQEPGSAAPRHQVRHQHNKPKLDDQVSRFARSLDLNEAQQAAVKKILEQRQQEILQIRLDPSMSDSSAIDRFQALQQRTVDRIRAVLNEEQKKRYDPYALRRIPQTPQPGLEDWLKATTQH